MDRVIKLDKNCYLSKYHKFEDNGVTVTNCLYVARKYSTESGAIKAMSKLPPWAKKQAEIRYIAYDALGIPRLIKEYRNPFTER